MESGVDIVAEVDFVVPHGSALGIVGESGCGKTTVAMALLGWARPGTRIAGGSVRLGENDDILALDEGGLRRVRGSAISYVPQNPSRTLSPGMRVGEQLDEMLEVHVTDRVARQALFEAAWSGAQLPAEPGFRDRYPHQLSGGQQQRVAIAMALACAPRVVVMDEPTTGLDVLTQERLLEVIGGLREKSDCAIVYISHDLGVVRNLVDSVAVMYGGRIVEAGPIDDVFRNPRHPYTRRLLEAIPRVHTSAEAVRGIPGHAVEPWNRPGGCPFAPRCAYRGPRCDVEMPPVEGESHSVRCWYSDVVASEAPVPLPDDLPVVALLQERTPVLSVRDLTAGYARRSSLRKRGRRERVAVSGVSFDLAPRSCLAVVGESGSGKTTLARCIAGLHGDFSGEIAFGGARLACNARDRDIASRRLIQIVFQDPDSSLNPSMTVGTIVGRPLKQFLDLHGTELHHRIGDLLERVHLAPSTAQRYPSELSGGEKQRVAIARAVAAEPRLLICDEVTSALDVAVQASILELLAELREATEMAMLFVSHDLAVVRSISDYVIVMADGTIREARPTAGVFETPQDEYTVRMLAAAPDLRPGDYPGNEAAPTSAVGGTTL